MTAFTDQHYLDPNGGLHFLSAQDQQNALAKGLGLPAANWTVATSAQVSAIQNPPLTAAQIAQAAYAAALAAGLAIASTGTPALNGVYDISPASEGNWAGSEAAVAAGVFRGAYRLSNGAKVTMTAAQFTAIATAAYDYIAALDDALAGGAWPSNTVTVP